MRRLLAALPLLVVACTVKLEYVGPAGGDGGTGSDGASGDGTGSTTDGGTAACGTLGGGCCPDEGNGCGAGLACVEGRCSCFADVATGHDHTCAVRADGSLWCWGRNDAAQAGNPDLTMNPTVPTLVTSLTGVVDVSAGGQHSCALLGTGAVACWGNNEAGQLGMAASGPQAEPVTVAGLPPVAELALGSRHSCARTTDGDVYCWGCQVYQDWTGCTTFDASPAKVVGLSQMARVWAHHKHTCARGGDGTTACWGRNDYGQLGDGTRVDRPEPTPVTLVPGIIGMAGGRYHACALREDGQVWCWANNESGQLGRGTVSTYEDTAQAVTSLPAARQVVAGGWYACALTNDGDVLCWGDGGDGQLGYGGVADKSTPYPTLGLVDVMRLHGGSFHVCAHEPDSVVCWGSNSGGSVGSGTGEDIPLPIRVMSCSP
jgi:alpha-tubulin suppressor-like RCC1 family protein